MNVDTALISDLQHHPNRIRNICILAHVDHGKTTLSDHLIASNGLIHPRLAGELRYMDSKEDEQARGITMKSSSISLLHAPGAMKLPEGPNSLTRQQKIDQGHLINLIDSPGHVDFCSEVSTAARLSDGALVVVDAVEGVCIQTHAVLRQAWEEKVALCLVINKMDRLVLELQLDPSEAYERIKLIVSHVNMIVSSFESEQFLSDADAVLATEDALAEEGQHKMNCNNEGPGQSGEEEEIEEEEEEDEAEDVFNPEKGNVAFGSAYDGWAYTTHQFADIYASKLGCSATALRKALWGDYALQPKTKRIVRISSRNPNTAHLKPLFVQLILQPLWKAYTSCINEDGTEAKILSSGNSDGKPPLHATLLGKIVESLGLQNTVSNKALAHPEPRTALRSVLRAWLPLSEAVLGMALEHLPSPVASARDRLQRLLPSRSVALKGLPQSPELSQSLDKIENALSECNTTADAPTVVYISKMVAVPVAAIPRLPGEPSLGGATDEIFLAFGRVFSGVLKQGQQLYVLPSTYNPAAATSSISTITFATNVNGLPIDSSGGGGASGALGNHNHHQQQSLSPQKATAQALYLMMGRGLERLQEVPSGNILAILGFGEAILKSATVASTPLACPLAPLLFQSAPIVTVAVEPTRPEDMPALEKGLYLLNRADPLATATIGERGEHLLAAAGEVHLETCIKDLKDRFARVELLVSPPVVAFKESIVHQGEEKAVAAAEGVVVRSRPISTVPPVIEATTPGGACTIRVRVLALPGELPGALDRNQDLIRAALITMMPTTGDGINNTFTTGLSDKDALSLRALREKIQAVEGVDDGILDSIWMLGPKSIGPCVLLSNSSIGSDADGGERGKDLWDVPAGQIIKVATKHQNNSKIVVVEDASLASASLPMTGDAAAAAAAANENTSSSTSSFVYIPLGKPIVSQKLGLTENANSSSSTINTAIKSLNMADSVGLLSDNTMDYLKHSVESGISGGFQLATAAGPLCDEPMWGIAFQVEARFNLQQPSDNGSSLSLSSSSTVLPLYEDVYGPLSGQITSAARQAFRKAVLASGPRLVESHFLCEVSTSAEALSAVYAVLGRRRGRVLREELREGSGLFTILAYMPTASSFGFADELRRRSSGAAAASLLLSHWQRVPVDPFYVPTTEEEREEWGEEGQGVGAANLAKHLIGAVRRRKGLAVEEKVVESATKQRTRARKV